MKMNMKFALLLLIVISITYSCGDPNEAMNKTMADFSEKCLQEEYDCDCYAKKVKAHFKSDEAYLKYYETHDAIPDELIDELGECSKNPDFDF
jgi:hypothetical protein